MSFDIGGKQGTWTIEPFVVSGVVNEVDHSGHWFDPGNSGWGFSLVEQGDVLGGALFTYDAAGEPTWVAGFERGVTSVQYQSFNGACPWCAYRAPTSQDAGRLAFAFGSETELTVRNHLAAPMAAGVALDGARVVQLGRPASARPADRQLASFDTAIALKAYLDAGMLNIPPAQGTYFSAPPPGIPFSATNLQESGVDEADFVKSDGRFVYTFAHDSSGVRQPAVRVAQVGNEGASLDVLGSVPLASGKDTAVGNAGLYVYSDNVVAVTGSQPMSYGGFVWSSPYVWIQGTTHVEVMKTQTSGLPVTRWRAEIDGNIVSSRRIGPRLYVVSRFVPRLTGFVYGDTQPSTVAANQQLLAATPLSALLPRVRIDGDAAAALLAPSSIYAPPQGARNPMADMILVTAIDLDEPRIAQSIAVVGSAETVYASTTHLFVATSRYASLYASGVLLPEPPFYLTDIHQIRIAADVMKIVGSASIEGYLGHDPDKASFRMSEYQNRLRVVTSSVRMWGAVDQNRLTILEPSTLAPGLLRTVSYLPNKRRPETLGKPHELLYSTRFLADRLYAVTFKKVDPLYVVDVADSTDPRIAGALEVPGFSDYLHPLPDGLLIGFGKDAKPSSSEGDGQFAWYQGLQLSLYDVSDAGQPREIQRLTMGKRGSESALLRDHHALSALMQPDGTGSFAIPARIHDGPYPQWGSGDSAFYPWQQSGLMRFELRRTSAGNPHVVQLPTLVTHHAAYGTTAFQDPATSTGRSVLFRNGTIYVGNGVFWRQDSAWNVFGPY